MIYMVMSVNGARILTVLGAQAQQKNRKVASNQRRELTEAVVGTLAKNAASQELGQEHLQIQNQRILDFVSHLVLLCEKVRDYESFNAKIFHTHLGVFCLLDPFWLRKPTTRVCE